MTNMACAIGPAWLQLVLSCALAVGDTNRTTVSTLSGRSYADATVLRATGDSVTLMLPDGVVRLSLTNLSTESRARLGLVPQPAPEPPAAIAADESRQLKDRASRIASLIDPAKLATLTGTEANPRMQKAVYWVEYARRAGIDPAATCREAVAMAGMSRRAAELTSASLLRSHRIAGQLGCLDEDGLTEMRKGSAPTVRKGPYAGDQLSVDHIIPRSVCPELASVIANLELMPMGMNREKSDRVTDRQVSEAKKFYEAGLLGREGLARVEASRRSRQR